MVQLKQWLHYHSETIKLGDDEVFLHHLMGVYKHTRKLLAHIRGRKDTVDAVNVMNANLEQLFDLCMKVDENVLSVKCNKAKEGYDIALIETEEWLQTLLQNEDYSMYSKNAFLRFLHTLTRDPLDGMTIQYERKNIPLPPRTVCYRGAIWRYNDQKEKILNIRAAMELITSSHGEDNLVLDTLIVNDEEYLVELTQEAEWNLDQGDDEIEYDDDVDME